MIKLNFDITTSGFEPITENSESKLLGGFSQSQTSAKGFDMFTANNCMGSNCADGCTGSSTQNTGCNTYTNCGKKL